MTEANQPTIVLVHGSFAESASWNDVIVSLKDQGHEVVAAALGLRGLAEDAVAVSDLVRAIDRPVLLVGHSYGGAVITNVAADAGRITGLVYIAGYALEAGESCAQATGLAPGGTLLETLWQVPLSGGGTDLYIRQDRFHDQFAADLTPQQTMLMAVAQRPVTGAALNEPSGDAPLWKQLPSWFLFGELDRNIPAATHRIMAERAGAKRTVELAGAAHAIGSSRPAETAQIILEAAQAQSLVSS